LSNFKFIVNEKYKNFQEFVLNIKNHFKANQNIIHKARNEIKVINHKNIDLVVKSFKIPNILNRFIYTFICDTKAKKSYEYSLKIGDVTPKAIGYIEFYENFLLKNSYFISENFNYDFTIREVLLEENFPQKEQILKTFALFTYSLHEKDIYHLDYSPGNILIKKKNDGFTFKIVDINRMKFLFLNTSLRMKNFSKLWAKDEDLKTIIKEYAKIANQDEKELSLKALYFSKQHKRKINFKKRLKGKKVVD